MSISNLNNVHLSTEQVETVKTALSSLEQALQVLDINLTPAERVKYGRVNEQNKLFINKVHDFAQEQPELRSMDVDYDEFFKDFESREILENMIHRLESLTTRAKNAKTLHDYDNYQNALNDYAYTSFRAGSNAVGFEDKYKELKQFFMHSSQSKSEKSKSKDKKKDEKQGEK